ncbi:hypothetical protein LT337_32105 (plasmid) [Mycolicibacterium fortuitum]|nr:hypothetical protein LT337_32105 [Mycolicibacterium fortuitum]
MTALYVAALLTTVSLLLNIAHRRRWWPPLSTPAFLTAFMWLATALSYIAAAIEAAVTNPDQPAAYAGPLVLLAILPLLPALAIGGPVIVRSLYQEALALERDGARTTSPDPAG